MKTPHFSVTMLSKTKARIEIYDEIGPSWAGMIDEKTVARALKEIGQVSDIDVMVNSLGGDVYDGLAIGNMFKAHPADVHGHVMGIAASAATLILSGCDTVTIPKNALYMIHDPATFAYGGREDMQKAINQLDAATSAGIEAYAAQNKKKSKEEIALLMKEETWFTGEEAVEAGFADQTDAEVQLPTVEPKATAQSRFRRAPSQFASLLAISMKAEEKPMPEPVVVEVPPAAPVAKVEIPSAVAPVIQAAEQPKTLTSDDVKIAADAAVKLAIEGERNRANDITALCGQAGRAAMANEFIATGKAVKEVHEALFKALCADRKPTDEGGTGIPVAASADPNDKYKAEYAKQKTAYMAAGMSEEDYIATRRIDDGVDLFKPKVEKAAA